MFYKIILPLTYGIFFPWPEIPRFSFLDLYGVKKGKIRRVYLYYHGTSLQ